MAQSVRSSQHNPALSRSEAPVVASEGEAFMGEAAILEGLRADSRRSEIPRRSLPSQTFLKARQEPEVEPSACPKERRRISTGDPERER